MKINNNKGAALIISYLVISSLLTLSAGFALSSVSELNAARRYRDQATAFWVAEAGLNTFLQNTSLLNTTNPQTLSVGNYSVILTKNDSNAALRIVTAQSTVGGSTRKLQLEFPSTAPSVFSNSMSSGGNLILNGLLAKLEVYGKTRLTGSYQLNGFGASATFEDKQEGVSNSLTTLTYPDSSGNGTADEFNDFVEFNRDIVATYNPSEVVYIQTNGTATVTPNSSLNGKKVIYVEGTSAGAGDVNIVFGSTWSDDQNMTIISTGTVNYIQPLQGLTDSKLNTISWEKYYEPSVLYSNHAGVNYSHGSADFFEVLDTSTSVGSVIGKTGINANETIAWKKFYYDSDLLTGTVPPGFEGLVGGGSSGYSSTPSDWKEI